MAWVPTNFGSRVAARFGVFDRSHLAQSASVSSHGAPGTYLRRFMGEEEGKEESGKGKSMGRGELLGVGLGGKKGGSLVPFALFVVFFVSMFFFMEDDCTRPIGFAGLGNNMANASHATWSGLAARGGSADSRRYKLPRSNGWPPLVDRGATDTDQSSAA